MGGSLEHDVFRILWFCVTKGAGGSVVKVELGWGSGEVAFPGRHLVDSVGRMTLCLWYSG